MGKYANGGVGNPTNDRCTTCSRPRGDVNGVIVCVPCDRPDLWPRILGTHVKRPGGAT